MWDVEKAVSPTTGHVTWLLLESESLHPHPEARAFSLFLRGASRSPQTMRAYLPRVGRFLNWCVDRGVDWRMVTVIDLAHFKSRLEQTTVPGSQRVVTGKTVNAVLTAVLEFLRFCAAHGYVDPAVTDRLSHRKFIRFPTPGFNGGENRQFEVVQTPVIKSREITLPPSTLTRKQTAAIIDVCSSLRDRFLVATLLETGGRIGEVLGLRREDLHLLPDSTSLGCTVPGAHVHFVPRQDNVNGARGKSGRSRSVPVSATVTLVYRDYQGERDAIAGADANDYVFVNLSGPRRGQPVSYSNVYQLLRRCGERVGIDHHHPHQFRHTAATQWLRSGAATDVVKELLGHASMSSTAVYLHANDDDKRAAVERVAASRQRGEG